MGEPLHSLDLLAPLLHGRRLGIITDVDGTIAPIAVQPEAAAVTPGARAALAALAPRLPVVGAMSGRELGNLRRIVDLPDLLYIGSHGLTWWYAGRPEIPEEALPYVPWAREAERELAALTEIAGVRFEGKGVGLAVHYRLASDADATRAAILAEVAGSSAAQRFELREGIQVVELFPRVTVNKGTALRRVVKRFSLDAFLFLGDDLTDVDAMYAAKSLSAENGVTGITVAVRHSEAPPLAAETADFTVESVADSEQILGWLARETESHTCTNACRNLERAGSREARIVVDP